MSNIRYEVRDHVAVITIDRPEKLNALTVAMDVEFNGICREANLDDDVRAVILTGARGEHSKAFCAGSDIGDLDEYGNNWQYRNRMDAGKDYVYGLWHMRKPVVAALFGYCIGGGLELACASDIRVVEPSTRFAAGEIRWGWHGGSGATQFLTRAVGPGHAARLLLTGEQIDATEAHRIGLTQIQAGAGEAETTARELAERIAAMAPIAAQSAKNLIRVATSTSVDIGMRYENDMFAYCMMTNDAAEGRRAFGEKRQPVFQGE
ncbi:enoyl-CoA hydratase-related protein [soil metagenome]